MIHTVPVSFVTSSNKQGSVRITLEIDDEIRNSVDAFVASPMGKQFLLVAYEIGDDAKDILLSHQDKDFAKQQLLKQVHAIIGEYSVETGVSDRKIKQLLKLLLKRKGLLKESMSELNEQGLSTAVYVLRTAMHPRMFNYTEYVEKT